MPDVDRSSPAGLGSPEPDEAEQEAPGEHRAGGESFSGLWWFAPLVTGVLTAALLGYMTWQVVVRGPVIAWDWPLHEYVDARQPSGFLRGILNAIAIAGGRRLVTLPIVITVGALVAWKQRNVRALVAVGAGLATVFFVGYWVKFDLARTAPHTGIDILHGDGQAFPSGHTANATLTWLLIVIVMFGAYGAYPSRRWFWRLVPIALIFVFVSGMLMTLLDYHWFSDIPGGWLLGGLALAVSNAVLRAPIPWPALPALTRLSRSPFDRD